MKLWKKIMKFTMKKRRTKWSKINNFYNFIISMRNIYCRYIIYFVYKD